MPVDNSVGKRGGSVGVSRSCGPFRPPDLRSQWVSPGPELNESSLRTIRCPTRCDEVSEPLTSWTIHRQPHEAVTLSEHVAQVSFRRAPLLQIDPTFLTLLRIGWQFLDQFEVVGPGAQSLGGRRGR